MSVTQYCNLNMVPGQDLVVVHVSQYDVGREIIFNLYDGTIAYTVPSGATGVIEGTKPDNKGFSLPVTLGTTYGSFETTRNMTAVPGRTRCEIRIKDGTDDIGTVNFILEVEPAGLADDVDISETELPEYIDGAHNWARRSEAWAKGTIDGVAVGSSDDAYHNNSKYFSEQASGSATTAGNSATAAGTSATNAATSAADSEAWAVGKRNGQDVPSSDPTYQNNAKHYAEIAQRTLPDGTTVSFRISNGHLYVQQTINGVPQTEQDLGQVVGSALKWSYSLTNALEMYSDGPFKDCTFAGVNNANVYGGMVVARICIRNTSGNDIIIRANSSEYFINVKNTFLDKDYIAPNQSQWSIMSQLYVGSDDDTRTEPVNGWIDAVGGAGYGRFMIGSYNDAIVIPAGKYLSAHMVYMNHISSVYPTS